MYSDKDYYKDLLSGMNAIMIAMNDESAYDNWITLFPDASTEEDIEEFAEDTEFVEECVQLFMKIYRKYSNRGLFVNNRLFLPL